MYERCQRWMDENWIGSGYIVLRLEVRSEWNDGRMEGMEMKLGKLEVCKDEQRKKGEVI